MSVYKPKGKEIFVYDFWIGGIRFSGSTGQPERSKAERVERGEKEKARAAAKERREAASAPLTISRATRKYWDEVGCHHANAATTLTDLNRLVTHFGPGKLLSEIGDAELADLIKKRRQETRWGRKNGKPVTPATVNRSTTEILKKVFNRAMHTWGERLPTAPRWKRHRLEEPKERVREVRSSEEELLDAIRDDYRPLIEFARESGLRMAECLMPKSAVDLGRAYVHVIGKGGKTIDKPITHRMKEILVAAMDNPTDHVFTYRAQRLRKGKSGHARGERLPITTEGLKTLWRRQKASGRLPSDLRFHDMRHDFGTKLLRETGNLKLTSKAMNHSSLAVTSRYAHVLDEEVRAGMEAASARRALRRVQSHKKPHEDGSSDLQPSEP